ncbi:MAG TPA: zinc-ribbon domain-containing protein [Candidatus Atribacteria bacterium]|nr:zinc-ribbon domain-containing protein [Candidatus Atribacteria bacterium]
MSKEKKTKYCTKCGFKNPSDSNFCSNCGASLSKFDFTAESETSNVPPEASWLDRCPVCKSGKLSLVEKKKLLGLVATESFECSDCNAIFVKKGEKYKLSKVQDKSNQIWQEYKHQALTGREWKNITYGGLSDAKQKEADIVVWMEKLREGEVPFHFGGKSPIILKKNERLQMALPNVSLIEPRAVRTGGYGGGSFRVTKGVSLRTGRFQMESHDELKTIDQGTFVLTDERVVFSGTKRTVNIDLKKILSIEPYSNGIGLRRTGKSRTEYFTGVEQHNVSFSIDGRHYKEPLSGSILMCLIEGLMKKE